VLTFRDLVARTARACADDGQNSRFPLLIPPPAKRWGRDEQSSLLGWHIVSGANDVAGGGWFTDSNVGRDYTMDEPPPGASRHPPHKRGRDRKELAMTSQAVHTHPRLRDLAAQFRASFADVKPSEIQRAQGMPGARRAAASRAKIKSTRDSHHGHTGIVRHSPRNGLRLISRSPQ
jgi:hypothetical protein